MNPQEPAQPKLDQAYITPGNAVEQTPAEISAAAQQSPLNSDRNTARRTAGDQAEAQPTSSALGAGPGAGADRAEDEIGEASPLDGEQMRAPGEGDVMRAQLNKTGTGEQPSLTSGLDQKKEEQRGRREAVKDAREEGFNVDGPRGQTGGPAAVEGR
ncbi:MAG: hypothetical protein M1838_005884 [Thelocarpon superellum]|nr:MAG: hypothetical protein M1838_005884 [Thelocarpon superellum]